MDVEFVNKGGNKRVHHRLGLMGKNSTPKICYFWQEGRCTKPNCPFLHGEASGGIDRASTNNGVDATKRPNQIKNLQNNGGPLVQRSSMSHKWGRGVNAGGGGVGCGASESLRKNKWGRGVNAGGVGVGCAASEGLRKTQNKVDKVCSFWMSGHCNRGDACNFLHSFFVGEGFTFVTTLSGHEKAVRGIVLPSGSDKLYAGSVDESVRIWDCQTGQCTTSIKLPGQVGCMISEGPWVFVGVPNFVKTWNIQTATDLTLNGPVGQVHALAVGNGMLLAGVQDGNILGWRFSGVSNSFEPAVSLSGHTHSVVSLVFGANRLFSGSMDKTIKVWNLETLQCLQTLSDHTSVVMSLLCWKDFLLSSSLDRTVKVWVAKANGGLEVTYTHKEEHGVLAMCGALDAQDQPVLICACNDNCVRLYELPSFNERGKIYTKEDVRAIQVGPGGLFFTGDGVGELKVWKWLSPSAKA